MLHYNREEMQSVRVGNSLGQASKDLSTEPQRPVQSALEQLEDQTKMLQDHLIDLSARLKSVLRPMPQPPESTSVLGAAPQNPDLLSWRITEQQERLRDITVQIYNIIERLEI